MTIRLISIISILVLAVWSTTLAQPRRGRPSESRLEHFKTVRLIELLQLDEEEAVRFSAKQSRHEQNMRDLAKSRNEAIDAIEEIVRNQNEPQGLVRQLENVFELDKKVFSERSRYYEELRAFLTIDQFGRFLAFERNFGRDVREAMREMRRGSDRRLRGKER